MTELLQKAIAQIELLPPERQNEIAARILAELEDEQQWETSFATTTDAQWNRMAEIVREEIASTETIPLEDIFLSEK